VMSYWVIFLLIFVLENKLQQIKLLVNNKIDLVKKNEGINSFLYYSM